MKLVLVSMLTLGGQLGVGTAAIAACPALVNYGAHGKSDPCSVLSFDCHEPGALQRYRQERASEWLLLSGVAAGPDWVRRQAFLDELLMRVGRIEAVQRRDSGMIRKWLRDLEISGITRDEIVDLIVGPRSLFRKKAVSAVARHGAAYCGPFIEGYKALCSIPDSGDAGVAALLAKRKPPCQLPAGLLGSAATPEEGLAELLAALEAPGPFQIRIAGPTYVTPFLAKLILTEVIDRRIVEGRVPPPLLKGGSGLLQKRALPTLRAMFWHDLKLKTDYSASASGRFHASRDIAELTRPGDALEELSRYKDLNGMVAHLGYELGADEEASRQLDRYGASLLGLGYDCSEYAGHAIRTAAGDLFRHRLSSFNIRETLACPAPGRQPLALETEFACEQRLVPGDLVRKKGHVYIFAGYGRDVSEGDSAPWRMMTIEATGGPYRAVGVFFRELPYEATETESCDLNLRYDSVRKKYVRLPSDETRRIYQPVWE